MPSGLSFAASAGAAAGLTAGVLRTVVSGADAVHGAVTRVEHVARNTLRGRSGTWRAGPRVHLPVRHADEAAPHGRSSRLTAAARKAAAELAAHPDVLTAHWDDGLGRLILTAVGDEAAEHLVAKARDLLAGHGLAADAPAVGEDGDDEDAPEETAHPGDTGAIRDAAGVLALDAAGVVAAVASRALRLPPSSRLVTAGVTLVRENPRARALLRGRFGRTGRDLLLAAANAAAHGAGQSPVSLLLDGTLRAGQLAEATARAAAFEALHDDLCAPGRQSLPAPEGVRPPLRVTPAQEYAAAAGAGSGAGAAAALLVKHDLAEAAEAVLAGSPKAARYGPAAFSSGLGLALARAGVLVRDGRRLRRLELADTLVVHPSALRPARDATGTDTGGGPERPPALDPMTEPVLDAARRAGLRLVLCGDPALGDVASVADEVAPAQRPFDEVVGALRDEGRVVLTVARIGTDDDAALVRGLLAGDLAVAVTDEDSALVWGADVLARGGLTDVWRLLTAIPAARRTGARSQALARAGAALSGLMVAGGGKGQSTPLLPGTRHAPVNGAAAVALFTGWRGALAVAAARPPAPRPRVPWHGLDPAEVRARLAEQRPAAPSTLDRLRGSAREATASVLRHKAAAPALWSLRFADAVRKELNDPLTPVLATGAAASALLGSVVDALLVVGAMDLNAMAGGVQRLRAEQALEGLAAGQKQKARRIQEGSRPDREHARTVDAARLSPGDEILLESGDVVPADARLVHEEGLEVDESSLTGESLPVPKQTDPTPGAPVAERHCMVFEGTIVVAGRARAVVVATDRHTEAGRATSLAARTPPAAGVQARLRELTGKALPLTLFGGATVSALSLLRGTPLRRAVGGGVAVAVAAVPEGLPLVATVAQMAAARRLSRRGMLVRTPRTLEALGRVDTVCFDKTGTLTENRLRLSRVAAPDGTVYAADEEAAERILRLAARACPPVDTEQGRRPAHATDEAVLDAAPADEGWTPTGELPFEASRGYAAATGHNGGGEPYLVVKGAPEVVLPACRDLPEHAAATAEELAGQGLRVLAVAEAREGDLEQPLKDLEFTGLLALADLPRATSSELLAQLREMGVLPVMLTGDHPQTAQAVAAQLGWPEDAGVVTGDELLAMDRSGRARALHGAGVVARVAPEQKLQVVEALQEAGRVVAMTGDGANDAAAIRAADVGIAITSRGSAAARGSADIVLTNGDLSVLAEAIHEGRALWRSVADAIAILIGGNAGEVAFSVLGTLISGASPLSTRQLLLVNLLTDMFPAMAVAVTPSDDEATAERARTEPMGVRILGAPLLRHIRRRGVTTCLGAVAAYLIGRWTPGTERRAGTMALCGVVGAQLAQTLAGRRRSPLVWATALGSAAVLVALVQTPGVSHFFGCTPLGPVAWAGVAAAIALAGLSPHLEQLPFVRRCYEAAARAAVRLAETGRRVRDASVREMSAPAASAA
ncbi:cation-translocating P-type ATPase [Streptomyces indicus]|nr:cation-translocating P-type ATPase [Streptomyces indicus]